MAHVADVAEQHTLRGSDQEGLPPVLDPGQLLAAAVLAVSPRCPQERNTSPAGRAAGAALQ